MQTAWEDKQNLERFALYKDAIDAGLSKLQKYYSRIDTKPVFILALGMFLCSFEYSLFICLIVVLHPYYKLDYIKLSWGGAEEQAKDRLEGNPDAKNWQDEALKVVEMTVSQFPVRFHISCETINRCTHITKSVQELSPHNHLPPNSLRMGNTYQ